MTALLTLSLARPGQVVRVGPEAAGEASAGPSFSELGLELGERISVEQLLYALMLQSSNDAAVALGEALSGTAERFVRTMNRRVRALGLTHTKFFSPSGVDDRGHSTARELATITRLAFRNRLFARIVDTKFHTIPGPSGESRHVENRNALLWLYPGAIGVKTGYTSAAGFCLVAAAARHGRRLLAVVLGDPSGDASFDDAASLLNYGYRGFRRVTLARNGHALPPVPVGTGSLPVVAGSDLAPLVPVTGVRRVSSRMAVRPGLLLPVAAGTRVGSVRYKLQGRTLGTVSMIVAPSGGPVPSSSPSPGRPPAGSPWWRRGAEAAIRFTLHAFWSLFG
jgi:D-alanyl-D-alanine carboxypeptidase (penicillin-binding protein 5/6)